MATEIERKFLLSSNEWRKQADKGVAYKQGYFGDMGNASVRVRLQGDKAYLNIKSATLRIRRLEFEYPIAFDEAEEMLEKLCEKPLIKKTRYHLDFAGHTWSIDEFFGENEGLVVAEIELQDENEVFEKPAWLGDEVSEDSRYYNVCLVKNPYQKWT